MSAAQRATQIRLEEQIRLLISRVETLEERVAVLEAEKEDRVFEFIPAVDPAPASAAPEIEAAGPAPLSSVQQERLIILQSIGRWIRGCLQGRRRGLSGRDRLAESNSVYLVFRDFAGRLHDPPLLFHRFTEAARLVKPTGDPGDSVFVGLPSSADALTVAAAADVRAPGA